MRPVRVEQRGRGRAVRQRELRASGPGPAGKLPFEPGVGALQLLLGERQSLLGASPGRRVSAPSTAMLHRVHHVQVEEAVEEAHVQRGHRVRGQQAHRPGMRELQVLDDDAGLDDVAFAVHQQRELAQRPAL